MKIRSLIVALAVAFFVIGANAQNAAISPELVAQIKAAASGRKSSTDAAAAVAKIAAANPDAAATIAKVVAEFRSDFGGVSMIAAAIVNVIPSAASAVVTAVAPLLKGTHSGITTVAAFAATIAKVAANKAPDPTSAQAAATAVLTAATAAVTNPTAKAQIAAVVAKTTALSTTDAARAAGVEAAAVTPLLNDVYINGNVRSATSMANTATNASSGIKVVVQTTPTNSIDPDNVSGAGGTE